MSVIVLEGAEILQRHMNKSQQGWKQCGRFGEEAFFFFHCWLVKSHDFFIFKYSSVVYKESTKHLQSLPCRVNVLKITVFFPRQILPETDWIKHQNNCLCPAWQCCILPGSTKPSVMKKQSETQNTAFVCAGSHELVYLLSLVFF